MRHLLIITLGLLAAVAAEAAPKMFPRMDTNHDGKVTVEEYAALFADHFQRMDKNRDGVLTEKEFNHKAFASADANKDGALTPDEYDK
jgi:Ca2+-binding EF-hand superfamily protein